MRKIIFLDIAGVLIPRVRDEDDQLCNRRRVSPNCLAALNVLADVSKASIVVMGFKKFKSDEHAAEKLAAWGVSAKVLGMLPTIPVAPWTKWVSVTRGRKIRTWLDLYGQNVSGYVILDDGEDVGSTFVDKHVRPNSMTGLTVADVKTALAILNKTTIQKEAIIGNGNR